MAEIEAKAIYFIVKLNKQTITAKEIGIQKMCRLFLDLTVPKTLMYNILRLPYLLTYSGATNHY